MKESLFYSRIEFWRVARIILYFTSMRFEEKNHAYHKSEIKCCYEGGWLKSTIQPCPVEQGLCPPCLWYIRISLLQDFFLYTKTPPEPWEVHHCRGKCGINGCSPWGEINSQTSIVLSPFFNILGVNKTHQNERGPVKAQCFSKRKRRPLWSWAACLTPVNYALTQRPARKQEEELSLCFLVWLTQL